MGTWGAWLASHIAEINQWLQFFILVGGLISTVYAIRHYRRKDRAWKKEFTDTGTFRAYRPNDE